MESEFPKVSGNAGPAAYTVLTRLFSRIKQFEDQYEAAQGRQWASEGEDLDALAMMRVCRIGIVEFLTDPANRIEARLQEAERETGSKPVDPWIVGNLRAMRTCFENMRGFFPRNGERAAQIIARYEDSLAEAEREWVASLERPVAEAWQAQIPIIVRVFRLVRENMAPVAAQAGLPLSEACLQRYCPGLRNDDVDQIFSTLERDYPRIVAGTRTALAQADFERAAGGGEALPKYLALPLNVQAAIFEKVHEAFLESAGWSAGELARQDINIALTTTQTGFCWGSCHDINVSVAINPCNFLESLTNAFHENNHMLYLLEMNRIGRGFRDQPVARFNGFGAHEFAAIYAEGVCLQRKTFELLEPIIRQALKEYGIDGSGPEWTAENLHRIANRQNPDNTDWCSSELALAPNMAYRTLAERRLLDCAPGELEAEVRKLPALWSQTMERITGIRHDPAGFSINENHWMNGLSGYFITYMQGAVAAAQMHRRVLADGLLSEEHLNAATLADYLKGHYEIMRDALFRHAARDNPQAQIATAVGGQADVRHFLNRLAASMKKGAPAPDVWLEREVASHNKKRTAAQFAPPVKNAQ